MITIELQIMFLFVYNKLLGAFVVCLFAYLFGVKAKSYYVGMAGLKVRELPVSDSCIGVCHHTMPGQINQSF